MMVVTPFNGYEEPSGGYSTLVAMNGYDAAMNGL